MKLKPLKIAAKPYLNVKAKYDGSENIQISKHVIFVTGDYQLANCKRFVTHLHIGAKNAHYEE